MRKIAALLTRRGQMMEREKIGRRKCTGRMRNLRLWAVDVSKTRKVNHSTVTSCDLYKKKLFRKAFCGLKDVQLDENKYDVQK